MTTPPDLSKQIEDRGTAPSPWLVRTRSAFARSPRVPPASRVHPWLAIVRSADATPRLPALVGLVSCPPSTTSTRAASDGHGRADTNVPPLCAAHDGPRPRPPRGHGCRACNAWDDYLRKAPAFVEALASRNAMAICVAAHAAPHAIASRESGAAVGRTPHSGCVAPADAGDRRAGDVHVRRSSGDRAASGEGGSVGRFVSSSASA
jgi:hypothetical protein